MSGQGRVLREDDGRLHPRWTTEQIIEAMQEWARLYGEPPRYEEWHRASPRHDPARYGTPGKGKRGRWPSGPTVQRRFGSWDAGLQAAGLEAHVPGVPRVEPPPRACAFCGQDFHRRDDEELPSFRARKTCSPECAFRLRTNDAPARAERVVEMVRAGAGASVIAQAEGMSRPAVANLVCRLRKLHPDLPARLPYGG
jgi:hypothetical protein